jgi:hypothetical protein
MRTSQHVETKCILKEKGMGGKVERSGFVCSMLSCHGSSLSDLRYFAKNVDNEQRIAPSKNLKVV